MATKINDFAATARLWQAVGPVATDDAETTGSAIDMIGADGPAFAILNVGADVGEASVGATLEARFIGVDRKNRVVSLSVREKEIQEEQEVLTEYGKSNASTGKTSLGDILKDQLGGN